ncbi:MAG: SDR family NAD(P)-dependent oxidoreductase [Thiolinea sp.]
MQKRFEGQSILITGAAGGLGREVARLFAGEGATLILLDRDAQSLQADFPEAQRISVDLLDRDATRTAIEQAHATAGGIDVLCALAGGFHMGEPVHDIAPDKWKLMDDLNVQTLLNTVRPLVPLMLEQGRGKMVTVGAHAALKGAANMGAYCASKSTVMRITESMAAELREHHINVNAVLPSIIDTPANRAAMPDSDPGQWVSPQQLYAVIAFLGSEEASAIHGALVPVVAQS